MEHKTDTLVVVERGRIVGELGKLGIIEALAETRPEGHHLAITPPPSVDELLKRLDASGLSGLATVTQNFEFNAIWSRAEILQAHGKIPQVKVWAPAPPAPPPPQSQEGEKDVPQIKINRVEAVVSKVETRPVAENLHREMERGRLAINTLAALDVPLMACDGSGTELFHNRAWAEIRLRESIHMKSDELVVKAKDAITESAMSGDLDIDKAIAMKQAPRGFTLYCKAIRDFENPAARAVGYIFWLVSAPVGALAPTGALTSYSQKTLPDILAAEEARAMAWAMQEANNNQSDAALLLGIPRQTFNYRYRKLMRAKK